MDTLDAATRYTKDGYKIVKCKSKSKAPFGKGWRDGHSVGMFKVADNIGFLAGEQHDGTFLVDLDLDSYEAREIAQHVFYGEDRPRHAKFHDKLSSHYWFRAREAVQTRRYLDLDGSCLMEIRGDGVQTIVEPSIHPSGEQIVWTRYVPFDEIPSDYEIVVKDKIGAIAAFSLIAKHWPEQGSRQHLVMALTGYLVNNNAAWAVDTLRATLDAVDENTPERHGAIDSTIEASEKGKKITGGPTIAEILGRDVYERFVDFLDLPEPPQIQLEESEEGDTFEPTLISAYDLLASKDFATDELVEGLIWSGKTHWLYSDPNVGKTMLALALALHVAAGKDFAGRAVQQGSVVIIEEDSSLAVIAGYLDTFCSIYDLNIFDLPVYFNNEQGIRIYNQRGIDKIYSLVDSCPSPPKLVVLDSCERILPSQSFNSREIDPLDRLLKTLANRGISNLVLDHTNKSTYENPKDMDVLYGSRAKSAIADIMIQLQGSIKGGMLNGSFTKFRGETPPDVDIAYREDGFHFKDHPSQTKTEYEGEVLGWFFTKDRDWMTEVYIEDELLPGGGLDYDYKVKRLHRTLGSLAARRILRRRKDLEGVTYYRVNTI